MPRRVPQATGELSRFLRASFDQHEQLLVSREEELAVVRAYLEIESLRFGDRLKVEGGADDQSGFVEVSNAAFLPPAAGRERGPTRAPFLAAGLAAPTRGPCDRTVARGERSR